VPVYEGPPPDNRTALLAFLLDWVREDDTAYRAHSEEERAEIARKKALRERMTRIARKKRPGQKRPWQSAGFRSRTAWLDAGQPPVGTQRIKEPPSEAEVEAALAPSRRESIEERLRRRGRRG
jgi:hypothetical protein